LRIKELYIRNLKAAADIRLELSPLTALVGPNGSGKTTILDALDHFFNGSKPKPGDFKNKRAPVTIAVTLEGVPEKDQPVTIERMWNAQDDEVKMEEVDTKGLTDAAKKRLLGSVSAVFVPAEHETDNDGTDKSKLQLSKFLRGVVAEEIDAASVDAERARLGEHYARLRTHIGEFEKTLNEKMCGYANDPIGYAPDFKASFTIRPPGLDPVIEVEFIEKSNRYGHRSAGHGTKRAYHMAALETHAEAKGGDTDRLLLVIVDEPEIHQHPQRQRRILESFQRLAKRGSCQVVYSTHSPALVDLREPLGLYRITRDERLNMQANRGSKVDPVLQQMRLSRHIAEGAFSHGVILVEGPHDEAMLTAILSVTDGKDGKSVLKELVGTNVNIVVCDGIGNVAHFIRFFQAIAMPIFAVWDADSYGSDGKLNGEIFELLGHNVEFGGSTKHDSCHAGTNYLCFSLDACLFFKDHLGFEGHEANDNTKELIKRSITTYEELVPKFDTQRFRNSDFVANVVPKMRGRFFGK